MPCAAASAKLRTTLGPGGGRTGSYTPTLQLPGQVAKEDIPDTLKLSQ